jgi:hypothetical protein
MEKPSSKPAWTSANIAEPSASLRSSGWVGGEKPIAEHFNWLLRNLSEWVEYLENKVETLQTDLESERLRAVASEQSLANQFYTERLRTEAQERLLNSRLAVLESVLDKGALEAMIQAETVRATAAEQNLSAQISSNAQAITAETTARIAADTALQDAIDELAAAPGVDPELQETVDQLVLDLTAESERAVQAESSISTALYSEINRSKAQDVEHSSRLTIVESRIDEIA